MNRILTSRWTKVVVFSACLLPFASLVQRYFQNNLGPDPVATITHTTGDWTLRFLVITLAITPFRKIFRIPQLIRFRRMVGLFAFFYACCHFTTYIWLYAGFDVHEMWKDVLVRRFITIGFLAFLLMIPLAITSTAGWIRRLGGRNWQLLHRAVYLSAIAGVIHYYWLVKSDVRKPLEYAWMVGLLLAYRIGDWIYRRVRRPASAPAPQKPSMPETAETV